VRPGNLRTFAHGNASGGQAALRAVLIVLCLTVVTTASCARTSSAATHASAKTQSSVTTKPTEVSTKHSALEPPYRVGSVTFDFVDHTRSTPSNGKAPAKPYRSLPTLVLYPATGSPSTAIVPGAPPAVSGKPFALIVFAHGYGSDGEEYSPLFEQWAAAGYVVAAPTFPLSSSSAPGGPSLVDYTAQPGDLTFVLNQVLSVSARRSGVLSGMIDPHRIAAVGHSLGAMTVLAWSEDTCCEDPLLDAAVVFDGIQAPFGKGSYFAGRTVPLLVLHGTADKTLPYKGGQQIYEDAKPPKFFVSLIGAPHTSFLQTFDAKLKPPVWEHVDVQSVLDFLSIELDHSSSALKTLDSTADEPGVASIQQIP
jgi:predicted esterase